MAEGSATSSLVDVHDLARRFGILVGAGPAEPHCAERDVHQDVDTLRLFDPGYPFSG